MSSKVQSTGRKRAAGARKGRAIFSLTIHPGAALADYVLGTPVLPISFSPRSAILSSPPHVGPRAKDHQASAPESLPPPEANAEAIHFLNSLRQEELQMLFFSETLAMVSNTGEPQGELTIDVQRGNHKDVSGDLLHCPLVHAYSKGFMDKTLCGNSLLGYLSWNLEIKEQHSQEFIKFHILPMERKVSLLKQADQLAMTRRIKEGEVSGSRPLHPLETRSRGQIMSGWEPGVGTQRGPHAQHLACLPSLPLPSATFLTQICPEQEVKTEVTFFPWHSVAGFISESANLLLLRVMAWRRMVPSDARFLALDTEGKLCYSTYQALGSQTIQVDHQQVEVFIVEQTVHSEEGIPMSCQFYLLPDGHLAKRVQVGFPGCCVVTKMPIIREEDEIEPRPVFEKKPLMWEEDMELYSRFLDRKVKRGCSPGSHSPPLPRPPT
nr:PREDICTED: ciliogenesis-associated TTC17-interacting protein isoform X3 [Rhinolophus sinicus]